MSPLIRTDYGIALIDEAQAVALMTQIGRIVRRIKEASDMGFNLDARGGLLPTEVDFLRRVRAELLVVQLDITTFLPEFGDPD